MTDFIVGHLNYWACIVLMMIGLYIVVSRGNFIKKIIGLSLFQTSVILLYITMGKVAGGTAPIYLPEDMAHHGGHGGEAHAAEVQGDAHASPPDRAADHGDAHGAGHDNNAETGHSANAETAPAKIANAAGEKAAALKDKAASAGHGQHGASNLPQGAGGDGDKSANSTALKDAAKGAIAAARGADDAHGATAHHGADGAAHGDAPHAEASAPNKYSNPLPHVLMLTAIVVGVATTAVGLALTVRIREAYGTIEEDDIQAADDAMEFGKRAFAEGPIV